MSITTFGEIMLRLKSPGQERLLQSPFLKRLLVEAKQMWLLLCQDWALRRDLLAFCQTIRLAEDA